MHTCSLGWDELAVDSTTWDAYNYYASLEETRLLFLLKKIIRRAGNGQCATTIENLQTDVHCRSDRDRNYSARGKWEYQGWFSVGQYLLQSGKCNLSLSISQSLASWCSSIQSLGFWKSSWTAWSQWLWMISFVIGSDSPRWLFCFILFFLSRAVWPSAQRLWCQS